MKITEVNKALDEGQIVHWNTPFYTVYKTKAGLFIKHKSGGLTVGVPEWVDNNASFYIEDGTPECTMYRGAFLFYDYIMNEWNVDIMKEIEGVQEIIFKAYYNSLEEAKAGVDEFMRGNTKN